ncbi:hypothetical protein [Egicoccus sp. AB-alg2]|uniref:hypothetical protein n=1 Tax=Egicoccus sp. AB-alg2 TaxID=3242693 RepID=UPI00359E0F6A
MTEVQLAPPATRHVAAGGWRRAVVGLLVGAIAAGLALRVLPPDDEATAAPRPGPG